MLMPLFLYNPAKPPSGAIPRFPLWEIVLMFFLIVYGVAGLFTNNSVEIETVLGNWVEVWNVAMIVGGVLAIVGLMVRAPDGLVINLAAMVVTVTASLSVAIALGFFYARALFPGSIALYIFSVGSLLRGFQLLRQIRRLKTSLETITRNGGIQ